MDTPYLNFPFTSKECLLWVHCYNCILEKNDHIIIALHCGTNINYDKVKAKNKHLNAFITGYAH